MIKRPKSNPQEPPVSQAQRDALLELLRERVAATHGIEAYDPVVEMALIATDPGVVAAASALDPLMGKKVALKAHAEVARYVHPTVKTVELSGPGGGPIEVKTNLASEIADLITKISGTTVPPGPQPEKKE